MVLPPLAFMMDPTMNVRGGSTILHAPRAPKNYSADSSSSHKETLSCKLKKKYLLQTLQI